MCIGYPVQQSERWPILCMYCELQLLHLLNSFKESFRVNSVFKKNVMTKPQAAAALAAHFMAESLSKIWEAPFSSMGRCEERRGVKIHGYVSRKVCDSFLIFIEVRRNCFVKLPASQTLGVRITSTRCCPLSFREGVPMLQEE